MRVSEKKVIIMIMAAVVIPVILFATPIGSRYRWGMYLDVMQEVSPISFYGKVVDGAGQPLQGVTVTAVLTKPNEVYILGVGNLFRDRTFRFTTDERGEFQIVGQRGTVIRMKEFKKSDYIFVPRIKGGGNWDTSFYYAGGGASAGNKHNPDPNNPVRFDMRENK